MGLFDSVFGLDSGGSEQPWSPFAQDAPITNPFGQPVAEPMQAPMPQDRPVMAGVDSTPLPQDRPAGATLESEQRREAGEAVVAGASPRPTAAPPRALNEGYGDPAANPNDLDRIQRGGMGYVEPVARATQQARQTQAAAAPAAPQAGQPPAAGATAPNGLPTTPAANAAAAQTASPGNPTPTPPPGADGLPAPVTGAQVAAQRGGIEAFKYNIGVPAARARMDAEAHRINTENRQNAVAQNNIQRQQREEQRAEQTRQLTAQAASDPDPGRRAQAALGLYSLDPVAFNKDTMPRLANNPTIRDNAPALNDLAAAFKPGATPQELQAAIRTAAQRTGSPDVDALLRAVPPEQLQRMGPFVRDLATQATAAKEAYDQKSAAERRAEDTAAQGRERAAREARTEERTAQQQERTNAREDRRDARTEATPTTMRNPRTGISEPMVLNPQTREWEPVRVAGAAGATAAPGAPPRVTADDLASNAGGLPPNVSLRPVPGAVRVIAERTPNLPALSPADSAKVQQEARAAENTRSEVEQLRGIVGGEDRSWIFSRTGWAQARAGQYSSDPEMRRRYEVSETYASITGRLQTTFTANANRGQGAVTNWERQGYNAASGFSSNSPDTVLRAADVAARAADSGVQFAARHGLVPVYVTPDTPAGQTGGAPQTGAGGVTQPPGTGPQAPSNAPATAGPAAPTPPAPGPRAEAAPAAPAAAPATPAPNPAALAEYRRAHAEMFAANGKSDHAAANRAFERMETLERNNPGLRAIMNAEEARQSAVAVTPARAAAAERHAAERAAPGAAPAQSGRAPAAAAPAAPGREAAPNFLAPQPNAAGPGPRAGTAPAAPAAPGAAPAQSGQPAAAGGRFNYDTYVRSVGRAESGSGGYGTGNPRGVPFASSASGQYQFINSTWNRYKPEGAPRTARAATPEQQEYAMRAFTADNVRGLTSAGLPVTNGTVYAAHNVGLDGAKALLTADPNSSAAAAVGNVSARNNPHYFFADRGRGAPLTVAQTLAIYEQKAGGTGGAPARGAAALARAGRDASNGGPAAPDLMQQPAPGGIPSVAAAAAGGLDATGGAGAGAAASGGGSPASSPAPATKPPAPAGSVMEDIDKAKAAQSPELRSQAYREVANKHGLDIDAVRNAARTGEPPVAPIQVRGEGGQAASEPGAVAQAQERTREAQPQAPSTSAPANAETFKASITAAMRMGGATRSRMLQEIAAQYGVPVEAVRNAARTGTMPELTNVSGQDTGLRDHLMPNERTPMAAVRGAVQGVTMGFGDELGLVDRNELARDRRENPVSSMGGELAGSLAPGAAISRGVGLAGRAIQGERAADTVAGAAGMSLRSGSTNAGATGAIQGGIQGAGEAPDGGGAVGAAIGTVAGGAIGQLAGVLLPRLVGGGLAQQEADSLLMRVASGDAQAVAKAKGYGITDDMISQVQGEAQAGMRPGGAVRPETAEPALRSEVANAPRLPAGVAGPVQPRNPTPLQPEDFRIGGAVDEATQDAVARHSAVAENQARTIYQQEGGRVVKNDGWPTHVRDMAEFSRIAAQDRVGHLDPVGTPNTLRALNEIDRGVKALEDAGSSATVAELRALRSRFTENRPNPATANADDVRAFNEARRVVTNMMLEHIENAMVGPGGTQTVQRLRGADTLYRDAIMAGDVAESEITARLLRAANNPNAMANLVHNSTHGVDAVAVPAVRELRETLGASSQAWNDVRQQFVYSIFHDINGGGGARTAAEVKQTISRITDGAGRAAAGEVLSPSELRALAAIGRRVEDTLSPGEKVTRFFKNFATLPGASQALGASAAVGGAAATGGAPLAGAVAGGLATARVLYGYATAPARNPALAFVRRAGGEPGRVGSGVIGGEAGEEASSAGR